MLTTRDPVSPEEKRLAIDQALTSQTLARSEKLRQLLLYICEMELAGRSNEISEYSIAVGALGRSELYSSTEDSSVRNRVFALRKKLDELYGKELREAPVRIELSKGNYCPRFVKSDGTVPLPNPVDSVVVQTFPHPLSLQRRNSFLPGFLAGAVLAGVAALTVYFLQMSAAGPDPVLREAWGPLFDAAANVAVVFTVSPGLSVRPYEKMPTGFSEFRVTETPEYLYPWYKTRHPVPHGTKLFMIPSHSQPSMGSFLGATAAVRLLTKSGASFEVMPETLLPFGATRNRNLILFGTAENSDSMRRLLAKAPFEIRFDEKTGDYIVAERDGARRVFSSKRDANGKLVEAYGLLTVLPSEGSDGRRRTVLISGTYSAAVSAATDFFCSPAKMREFQEILVRDGQRSFPVAYQLVIQATTDHVLPLGSRYATHRTLP